VRSVGSVLKRAASRRSSLDRAAIAFPLFVRGLLQADGTYELTPRDLAMIEVFVAAAVRLAWRP
jgi:hypothetical protein